MVLLLCAAGREGTACACVQRVGTGLAEVCGGEVPGCYPLSPSSGAWRDPLTQP